MSDEPAPPNDYVVGHVQAAFAADGAVAELGLEVHVVGDQLFLSGHVSSPEQRARAGEVAAEVAPHLRICNDLDVVSATGHGEPERLP